MLSLTSSVLPSFLNTCKSLGSLRISVISLIEQPVISFRRKITTKVSIWLDGIKLLDPRFGAVLVNLFGICFRGPINFGSTSYLTSTPLAPLFSITPLLHLAQSLGIPLSKPRIFSRTISLCWLAWVNPLFSIVIGPHLDPFVLMSPMCI